MHAKILNAALMVSLMIGSTAVGAVAQPDKPKLREVNITADSASGWLPSEELEATAMKTAHRFFSLEDSGDDQASYAMLTPNTRAMLPFGEYKETNTQFRRKAGTFRQRRILKLTWTKNPANAPQPGIYAAIDASATFEGVDRQCGYIILFQSPEGGAFNVMRTENNFIDNASAKEIARTQSAAALAQLWAQLSTNCPNFQAAGS
jgi:hypothetical protein